MNCPICQKPQSKAYRPFCSGRCADVDLGRWMSGSYAIPDTDLPSDETPRGTPETDARHPPEKP